MKKYLFTVIGLLGGAACGFAYWYFVGCAGGTCPITSSPTGSTVYGAVMGLLLSNIKNQKRAK